MMTLSRYWFNQPSTLQPFHHLHGKNVLYDKVNKVVYFTEGDIICQQVPINPLPLSKGWKPK